MEGSHIIVLNVTKLLQARETL
ncbi:unnamed protein product [Staurois parvus]|uniref:Uncharacterized protein n=1 Tax=Staurois parvus TaxID=386267 RepID=A0ABN9BBM5_9NEOB|nr:unnamed protein product [Staurois parvus]